MLIKITYNDFTAFGGGGAGRLGILGAETQILNVKLKQNKNL